MAMSLALPSLPSASSLIPSFNRNKNRGAHVQGKEYSFLQFHDASRAGVDDDASPRQQTAPVSVKQDGFWSYCGPSLAPSTPSDLPASFHEFADATFAGPVPATFYSFLDFLKTFLAEHGLSTYLLTVRATTPTSEYDQPRWHTDELFFSGLKEGLPGAKLGESSTYKNDGGKKGDNSAPDRTNWKICTTLLGPQTLFIPLEHQSSARDIQRRARQAASTEHDCISIRCVGCASAAETVRDRLALELAPYGVEVAAPGHCAFFQVGRDTGAVHSEPRMSGTGETGDGGENGRIFINVVPGTEGELRAMMNKWGMEFPRQWWLGGNVTKKPAMKTAA